MIYILIPSYNDSENFPLLFENISKFIKTKNYKIIIIDDGSTDNTRFQIKKLSIKYPCSRIGYKKNKGPGFAFNFGFNYLIPDIKNSDTVITMEADNSSDLSILTNMIKKTRKYDIVLSSPFAKDGKFLGLTKERLILGFGANFLDRSIFRLKNVKTYSSFYRAFRAGILKKLREKYNNKITTDDGFSAVVEMLLKLNNIKAKIIEVPATVDWRGRKGKSKMKLTKTIFRHLVLYKNYFSGKYN